MQKEGQKSSKYDFEFKGGKNNSYVFETNYDITYEVKFKPSSYLFDERYQFSSQVFEMVIAVTESKNLDDKIPPDGLIMFTIAEIVTDFFKNRERIIVYICDTADARHLARARKFGLWFEKFKTTQFMKIDASITDEMGIIYMNALILHRENPYFVEIIDAFRKVTGGYSEDK